MSELRQRSRRRRIRYTGVLWLYVVRLRQRWPQELLAVIGITVGVALLFASQVASTSLSGPVKNLTNGIVGNSELQVVARGADGFPQSTYTAVRDVPGVRIAAPILEVQANVVGRQGSRGVTLFGADPRVVQLRGSLLQGFTADDAAQQRTLVVPKPIARSIGVRFGEQARLMLGGRTRTVAVATVDQDDIGALNNTAIALAPLAYLQRLSGLQGRLSRIMVQVEPGQLEAARAGMRRVVGDRANVVAAEHDLLLFNAASAPTSQATTIFSVLSALVGFLFAFCAMLVTAASRRALATNLRLSGYRPTQVVRMILVDALALGVVAVLAGLALGEALSRQGFSADVGFLSGAFPVGEERIVRWSSIAIAAAGGMLAATLGVLAPLRGSMLAQRSRGTEHPPPRSRATLRQTTSLAGGACLVGAIVLTVLAPGAAIVGLVVLTLSLALLLPAILDAAIWTLLWASRRTRHGWVPAVELALRQLRAPEWRVRSLAITMTGAIAVFGSVSLQGSRSNLEDGLAAIAPALNDTADVWVSPFGPGELFGTTPVEPTVATTLRQVSGVRDVDLYRAGYLDFAGGRALVFGPPRSSLHPVPQGEVLDGDARRADERIRVGGWMTVSQALAAKLEVDVGDRFRLPSPVPLDLRIAAITTNLGWSGGAVVLNADDYARAWGTPAVGAFQVRLDPMVSAADGRRRIADALGTSSPWRVETAEQRSERQQATIVVGLARLSQITSLTLVAAVLAMAAAIAGLLWQHRRAIARQKLDGHKTARMWRGLVIEAGTLVVTGCVAGAVFALLGQVLCTRGVAAVTGFPVVNGIRFDIVAWSAAAVALASILVIAIPGYLVARVRPALRD